MNLILKHDPVWLGSLPSPDASTSLVLLGVDGHQVAVPAPLLLAVSPLVRNILSDLLPPAYCPCFLSIPATGEVLQVVMDILTTGTVAGDHVDEVRQVLGMLGVEALIVSYQLESIQVGQVLQRDFKEELSTEGPDIGLENKKIKMEVIVKLVNEESTNIETEKESKTFKHSLKPKNFTLNKNTNSCTLCSKKFASRSLLKSHIEFVHCMEISCSFCPQKFTLTQTLRRHIKSKHGKSENSCRLCSKKFTQKGNLEMHIKSVHDQIKFQCNLCPQKFTRKGNLATHIKSVHDQIKIQCNLCPKKFTLKQSIARHVKKIHG